MENDVAVSNLAEGYKIEENSLWGCNKDGEWVKLTGNTCVYVIAHFRSPNGKGWGKQCVVTDLKGNRHSLVIYNADLGGGGKSAVRMLADHGLTILPTSEKAIVSFILLSNPDDMNIRSNSTGWLESSEPVFVLPHQIIGRIGDGEKVVYEPELNSKTSNSITASGSLKEWKLNVAELARNNQILVFGILAALAGCLFRILGIDGAGWHIHGHSSRGKTTWLVTSGSVWGNGVDPAIDSINSYVRRWNTTGNALEAIAAAHCDMAICLDELGGYSGTNLDRDVYLLTGGQGKSSLTSQRSMRATRTWRGNCLSTGEKSFKTAIMQSGKHFMAGQMLRMVDLLIENVLPNPPEGMTAAEFSVELKNAAASYYGVAGPAFVKCVINELNEDREGTIEQMKEMITEYTALLTPPDASPEQGRVYQRMATVILAGEIGACNNILPFEMDEIIEAVTFVRDLWLAENTTIADTDRSLVELQQFLIRNHASFPSTHDEQARSGCAKAFWSPQQSAFLFTDDQFRAAINGGGEKEVLLKLRKLGFLVINEPGRLKVKHKIASANDKWVRFYTIKSSILEFDSDGSVDSTITLPAFEEIEFGEDEDVFDDD